ncbi:MAG: hypothetical protein HYX72_03075 [Acidobacteria bacterium]|nr:hypothetical protein [Acidobacteriota bacterium]
MRTVGTPIPVCAQPYKGKVPFAKAGSHGERFFSPWVRKFGKSPRRNAPFVTRCLYWPLVACQFWSSGFYFIQCLFEIFQSFFLLVLGKSAGRIFGIPKNLYIDLGKNQGIKRTAQFGGGLYGNTARVLQCRPRLVWNQTDRLGKPIMTKTVCFCPKLILAEAL